MNTFEKWVPGPESGKDVRARVEGVTDTNGLVTLQVPSLRGSVKYGISVDGEYFDNNMKMEINGDTYYRDQGGEFNFTNNVAGKWQPWDALVEIQVNKVVKPTPMYARSFFNSWPQIKIPEMGKDCGFDLVKGDWTTPYGIGEVADIYFNLDVVSFGQRELDRGPLFDATFSVTFSEDNGMQSFFSFPLTGSVFRSPYIAPETGYSNILVKKSYEHETESYRDEKENQNYIFRIRTERDEFGNITSALYGKIYGDVKYSSKGVLRFAYYLNPPPNDRNLEFDPSRNLFKNLPPAEVVQEP
jgi:hypothetical protein